MNIKKINEILKSKSSEKYKNNVVKLGIPYENSLGVPTGEIRKLAKKIIPNNDIAFELYDSMIHEKMILAVLIFEKNTLELSDIKKIMRDVQSWDLCDHLCKNLLIDLDYNFELIELWYIHVEMYFKRAAFVLIIANIIKRKEDISEDEIKNYIEKIILGSSDSRPHVRKAISWALREIGKINFIYQEIAIQTAYELMEMENKNSIWIGKNALKELESLVKIEERGRLIRRDSRMEIKTS